MIIIWNGRGVAYECVCSQACRRVFLESRIKNGIPLSVIVIMQIRMADLNGRDVNDDGSRSCVIRALREPQAILCSL